MWTVWVGGTEVTDHYVDRDTADSILTDYLHKGYDESDVWIEEVTAYRDRVESSLMDDYRDKGMIPGDFFEQ